MDEAKRTFGTSWRILCLKVEWRRKVGKLMLLVAVKFLGPQLSFCKPGQSNSEWTNVRIENPCFYSSRVMFCIPGSGGHLIGSWDLCEHSKHPELQRLRYKNIPKLTKTNRELLDSCYTSQHLVESITTGETFLVKWYKKTTARDMVKMKTIALMVFKLDEQGNAVYTQDIRDLVVFLSKSEPFCVPASSFPSLLSNRVEILDVDEYAVVDLDDSSILSHNTSTFVAPYHIPPQTID